MGAIDDRIERLDISLFDHIDGQTHAGDTLRAALRDRIERPWLWNAASRFKLAGPLMSGVSLLKAAS